ncbi:Fic family protein [Pseudoclavibacter helvolus]|uniref:Fic family protein n=1 Tax=Pseudoclavibacter helvolus TaxID=255205 RepID=UPI0024AC97FB|nr:Fic family protein [Pseudoclavibacter helvolus]
MRAAGNGERSWPELTYEDLPWDGPVEASYGPGAAGEGWRTLTTYRAAVPPFIAEAGAALSADVLAASEAASAELVRFDAHLGDRVAAFAPVLLRSESASSSQIEHLTASARSIFTAELGATSNRNAIEIAANTSAMGAAIDLADNLTPDGIRRVHEVLMHGQDRHTPGLWRQQPVWIGTRSDSPRGATYVAPHHDRVPDLIDDLVTYMHRRDVPALAHVALSHAQFETIHPFTDGNGRTGRALAQSLLRARGTTRNVAVPVSAGLLSNIEGYHSALTAFRTGEPTEIVRAFTDAAQHAVWNARILVDEIDEITAGWRRKLKARSDSNAWPLLDIISRRPVVNAVTAAAELGVATPNAYPPLRALTEHGILVSKREYRQSGPFWRSPEILQSLDRFAERAGRRA